MFKAAMCILIVICSAIIGCSYSNRLYKRRDILKSFVTQLSRCSTYMRYSSSELSALFRDNFMNYKFVDSKPFNIQWDDMLSEYQSILTDGDIQVLRDFAKNLGATDAIGQQENFELYLQMINRCVESAEEDIAKKSKLYKSLGISFGITLSIVLI